MIPIPRQCPSRYTVGEHSSSTPIFRRDGRACMANEGHDGPHHCLLGHTWTDEPEEETA